MHAEFSFTPNIYCLTLKALGFFLPVQHCGGCFPPPLCKIRSKHPRELKLTGLIAYIMFYKIRKFGSSTITNDVIMMSLPKTMAKFGPPRNQTKLYIIFEPLCQKLWAFLSNFGHFYDARSLNMVMSRDPRSKFRKNFILSQFYI